MRTSYMYNRACALTHTHTRTHTHTHTQTHAHSHILTHTRAHALTLKLLYDMFLRRCRVVNITRSTSHLACGLLSLTLKITKKNLKTSCFILTVKIFCQVIILTVNFLPSDRIKFKVVSLLLYYLICESLFHLSSEIIFDM